MKQKNCEISHTSYEIINENNFRIGYRKARDFNSLKDLLRSCDIGLSSVLLKKKLLKKGLKFPKLKTKEDFVLWLRIVSNGNKIFGLNQNLTKWRDEDLEELSEHGPLRTDLFGLRSMMTNDV